MDAEKRAEQEALKAELETQQTEVASVITKVENSQQGTWISVKEDSRRVTENFNNWWERTKANLDGDRNKDRNKNVR
jgi:TPP-dependent trihydroxycyclohexane-1,2-dione (THcHDO) dehydratase